MRLVQGSRIGAYEVLGSLGAGGMGEVYRARDTRLDRQVALKILPEAFASDPERMARFDREARLLAALNHPSIASIHGLEESDGIRALVLELVEGETLADLIAAGPLPVDEALRIARQIAEAVDAAHGQGIIHRDLKPANIKITPSGTAKVLDLGLARLAESTGAIASRSDVMSVSPTITSPAMMTGVGVLLGTAAYMPPEQARGRVADRRADIWAFGCVLYEMLTGRRAFDGSDVTDVLASVLKTDPDFASLPSATPPHVRTLIERCLEKDPARRMRDMGDVRWRSMARSRHHCLRQGCQCAADVYRRRAGAPPSWSSPSCLVGSSGLLRGARPLLVASNGSRSCSRLITRFRKAPVRCSASHPTDGRLRSG